MRSYFGAGSLLLLCGVLLCVSAIWILGHEIVLNTAKRRSPATETNIIMRAAHGIKELRNNQYNSQKSISPERNASFGICSNRQRLQEIANSCTNIYGEIFYEKEVQNTPYKVYTKRLFVNDEHKLLICVPFKCGSSSMFNMLAHNSYQVLHNVMPKRDIKWLYIKERREIFGIKNLYDFNATEILKRLISYDKILVVRHPLVRVLSFYMDKLHARNKCVHFYQNDIGRKAILWNRGKLTKHELRCSDTLQFREFFLYFSRHLSTLGIERHLVPINKWCSPCHIKYDYVMKLDTGKLDQQYILQHYVNANTRDVFHSNSHLNTSQEDFERNNFNQLFKTFQNIHPKLYNIVKDYYQTDMDLFGYQSDFSVNGLRAKCKTHARKQTSPEQASYCC